METDLNIELSLEDQELSMELDGGLVELETGADKLGLDILSDIDSEGATLQLTSNGSPLGEGATIGMAGNAPGLMSANDKAKLDEISPQANNYELPIAGQNVLGGVRIGFGLNVDSNGVLSVSIPNGDEVSY